MQVVWQKFINAIAGTVLDGQPAPKQFCPLHGGNVPSLAIETNNLTGHPFFVCTDRNCRFYGDAVQLVAKHQKIDVTAALNLFKAGGKFNHTLVWPDDLTQLQDYKLQMLRSTEVQGYMVMCRNALLTTAQGALLRGQIPEWLPVDPKDTPASMGVFLPEVLPQALAHMVKYKQRNTLHLQLPYTFNHRVTAICLQPGNPTSASTLDVIVPDTGMLFEETVQSAKQLIVAPTPYDAIGLLRRFKMKHAEHPAVTSVLGTPLPATCNHLDSIVLVGNKANSISIELALALYVADAPNVSVQLLHAQSFSAVELIRSGNKFTMSGGSWQSMVLATYILKAIAQHVNRGDSRYITRILHKHPLRQDQRERLIAHLQSGATSDLDVQTLTDLLDAAQAAVEATFTLGNKRVMRQTAEGLVAVTGDATPVLTNAKLVVLDKVLTRSKELMYRCQLSVPELGESVTVSLRDDITTARALQQEVQRAFADLHKTAYAAFYDVTGFKWADILAYLGRRAPLRKEIAAFGPATDYTLNFPKIVVNPAGVHLQTGVFSIDPAVESLYSGLEHVSAHKNLPAFRKLIEAAVDNSQVAGFVVGLSHIIAQMATGLITTADKWSPAHKHLCFVETHPGAWQPLLEQLAALFNGEAPITRLNLAGKLPDFTQLGGLPLCAQIYTCANMADRLNDLPFSLVTTVTDATATSMARNPAVSFVSDDDTVQNCTLHADDLVALRFELPTLLSRLTEYVKTTPALCGLLVKSLLPADIGYNCLCALLGVTANEKTTAVLHRFFTSGLNANLFEFFDRLHNKIYRSTQTSLRVSYTQPTKEQVAKSLEPHIYICDLHVVIRKSSVAALFAGRDREARLLAIEAELGKNELLLDAAESELNSHTCWVVSIDTWNKYVARESAEDAVSSARPRTTRVLRLTDALTPELHQPLQLGSGTSGSLSPSSLHEICHPAFLGQTGGAKGPK